MSAQRRRDESASPGPAGTSSSAGTPSSRSASSRAASSGSASGGAPSGAAQRLRPAPTSALSPAPGSLMPVPNDDGPSESGRAGRRQHHRAAGRPRPDAEDLVYLSGRIPRQLRDELHVRAIGEGRPVVELMRDALRGYLDQHAGPGRS